MALWIVSWGTVAPRRGFSYIPGNGLDPKKGFLDYMAVGAWWWLVAMGGICSKLLLLIGALAPITDHVLRINAKCH